MKTLVTAIAAIALIQLGTAQAAEYSRTRVVTGPNGKTATTSRTTTLLPHGRSTEVTGPHGNSWNKSVYRGPFGHVRGVSVTGPQGNTRRVLRIR